MDRKVMKDYVVKKRTVKRRGVIAAICLLSLVVIAGAFMLIASANTNSSLPASESENNNNTEALEAYEYYAVEMDMYVTDCVNTYKADITHAQWNGHTAGEATVHDVCVENGFEECYSKEIGGIEYHMVWTESGDVMLSGGEYDNVGVKLNGDIMIRDLADGNY